MDTHACIHSTAAHDPESRWEYALQVPHDARAIGIARATLTAVLTHNGLTHLLDTAALLASELLTNAYLHSGGPASLRLRWKADVLRLAVWDTDPTPPEHDASQGHVIQPREEDEAEALDGRGLRLVRVCADDWGWFLLGDDVFGARGKYIWCDLAAEAEAGRRHMAV